MPLFVRHFHHDVRRAPLIAVGAAHRRRANPLHAGPFVNVCFAHHQLVHIHVFVEVLRVGDGRLQNFLHRGRDALVGGAQRVDGGPGLLAADQIDH